MKKLNKKHCAEFIFYTLALLFFVWVCASFVDTNTHNQITSDHYGEYAEWNIFNIFN